MSTDTYAQTIAKYEAALATLRIIHGDPDFPNPRHARIMERFANLLAAKARAQFTAEQTA
jgi:hypothetical protein